MDDPEASGIADDERRAALLKLSDELGVVPSALRCILPDAIRLCTIGDHVVVTDEDGNRWISISSFTAFRDVCMGLGPGSAIWVVISPHLALHDANYLMDLVVRSMHSSEKEKGDPLDRCSGKCCGVTFIVKNMPLLKSKAHEYDIYSKLSLDVKSIGYAARGSYNKINISDLCQGQSGSTQTMIQDLERLCHERRVHLILSMYWRDYYDDSDPSDQFGPHQCILKLLPELHSSIYSGPDKYDPCHSLRNYTDSHMKTTKDSLVDAMSKLMDDFPHFNKYTSVDQQSILLLQAEGKKKKLLELTGVIGKVNDALLNLEKELTPLLYDIDCMCMEPSLVGNCATAPEWMLIEDDEVITGSD